MEFVDKKLSSNLPAGTQALVEVFHDQNTVLQELLSKTQEESALALRQQIFLAQEEKASKAISESVKGQYSRKKFGSGGVAALAAFFTANQSSFVEMLGTVKPIAGPEFGAMLGLISVIITLYFGMLSFYFWRIEQRKIARQREILVETGFQTFIDSPEFCRVLQPDGKFSLLDLIDAVKEYLRSSDNVAAQEIAELICQKLALRDLAVLLEGAYLSPMYELNAGLTEKLLYQPPATIDPD